MYLYYENKWLFAELKLNSQLLHLLVK